MEWRKALSWEITPAWPIGSHPFPLKEGRCYFRLCILQWTDLNCKPLLTSVPATPFHVFLRFYVSTQIALPSDQKEWSLDASLGHLNSSNRANKSFLISIQPRPHLCGKFTMPGSSTQTCGILIKKQSSCVYAAAQVDWSAQAWANGQQHPPVISSPMCHAEVAVLLLIYEAPGEGQYAWRSSRLAQ